MFRGSNPQRIDDALATIRSWHILQTPRESSVSRVFLTWCVLGGVGTIHMGSALCPGSSSSSPASPLLKGRFCRSTSNELLHLLKFFHVFHKKISRSLNHLFTPFICCIFRMILAKPTIITT